MKKYVYSFGGGTADGDGKMRDMLGGKGRRPRRNEPSRGSRSAGLHHLDRGVQPLLRKRQQGSERSRRPDPSKR